MPDITDTTLAASNAPVAAVAEAAEAADTADIADTTSDITITDAEAEANPEKKENLRELREKAMAQYETIGEDAHRLQRLNSLLEKSAAYVTFVSKKLDTKRAQLRTVEPSAQPPKHSMQSSAAKRMHKAKAKLAIQSEAAAPAADADAEAEVSGAAGQPEEPVGDGRTIDGQKVSPRQPQLITGGIMREYQLEGMEWLASLYENGLNGILADEMGLGKTLQTIAFLCFLRERKVWGPFLILCPLSTLSNWVSEFYRFTPNTPVLLYHGNPDERKELRRKHLRKLDQNFPIVVTTYEISMRDKQALQKFAWKFIIIDEGHRIKNMNCKLIRDLKSYQSTNRLLLTGTPLQNSLSELWSLLNFLLPDIFDDLESFQA
ncbi:putative ATPase, partial [Kickxella alabastrina]